MRADGGEALGQNELAAVGVRGGGGLLDEEAVGVADAMPPRPGPELAHGRVVEAEALLGVDRHRVRPAGLRMNLQPVPVGAVAEEPVVIVDGQVAHRPAKVVQEAVAHDAAVHDPAGDDRQVRQQVVAAALAEFLAQRGRPVGDLDLPTIRVQILERLARQRSGIGDQRLDHRIPVGPEGFGVERVQGVPIPALAARRDAAMIVERVAETQDVPGPGRRIPTQRAVLSELARQVQDLRGVRVFLPRLGGKLLRTAAWLSGAENGTSGLSRAFCSQFCNGRCLGPSGLTRKAITYKSR